MNEPGRQFQPPILHTGTAHAGLSCLTCLLVQVKPRDYIYVKILGKIGWVAKALVYSIIGGQCCNSAVGDDSMSISPQVPSSSIPTCIVGCSMCFVQT